MASKTKTATAAHTKAAAAGQNPVAAATNIPEERQAGEAGALAPPSPLGGGAGGEGKAPAEPVTTHLLVTSRREGFRRAGRPWSATPTLVEAEGFSEDQVKALLGEPMLDVLPMTAEAAEAWAKRD